MWQGVGTEVGAMDTQWISRPDTWVGSGEAAAAQSGCVWDHIPNKLGMEIPLSLTGIRPWGVSGKLILVM